MDCWCQPIMLETPINFTYESVNGDIVEDVIVDVVHSAAINDYIINNIEKIREKIRENGRIKYELSKK